MHYLTRQIHLTIPSITNSFGFMINTINESWGWMQIEAKEMIAVNPFGNVIFNDKYGKVWKICPEQLTCDLIAIDEAELEELMLTEDFQLHWQMTELVALARGKLGEVNEGEVYCLKFPPVLGGLYDESNLGIIAHEELLRLSGQMAFHLKDAPDGTKINIDIEGLIP